MSMRQFANSLGIIHRSEHANRPAALCRHLYWQARKLGFPRPVHLRLSRSEIVDDEPGGVISMVNMLGLYDYNNMNFVLRLLERGGLFADVGANIGAYTLVASEQPDVSVVSIEPNPTAFAKLSANVTRNGRHRVTLVNMGASDAPGQLCMTNNSSDPTNRVVEPGSGAPGSTIMVEMDTLDRICARTGAMPVLIKIDVEGHEPAVLSGAHACLAQVRACIIENGERAEVVRPMWDHGLRGPFYYRHGASMLSHTPQSLAEDAVFIGPTFERDVPGIAVPPGPGPALHSQ